MELKPLAAKIRLDAAFVAGLVTDLIAALRQRDTRYQHYGQQCERAPLHFFPWVFRPVRRFVAAFFEAFFAAFFETDFFGGAGILAAVAATAEPATVLRGFLARLGAETAARPAG
jgi:hypothetical protein